MFFIGSQSCLGVDVVNRSGSDQSCGVLPVFNVFVHIYGRHCQYKLSAGGDEEGWKLCGRVGIAIVCPDICRVIEMGFIRKHDKVGESYDRTWPGAASRRHVGGGNTIPNGRVAFQDAGVDAWPGWVLIESKIWIGSLCGLEVEAADLPESDGR